MSEMTQKLTAPLAGLALVGALVPTPALAYVGAGAGLSAIGSVLSFLGVLLLMIVGFVWYPVKRLLKKRRGKAADEAPATPATTAQPEE